MAKKEKKNKIVKSKEVVETPESKIKEISTEVKKQIAIAGKIEIKTQADIEKATEVIVGVKARIKRIDALRIQFVKPLKDHIKTIEAMFKEQSEPLEAVELKLKRAIADYTIEQDRKARAEQDRLAKVRENANAKREEKGLDAIVAPIKTVEQAESVIRSEEGGKVVTSTVWKYRIVDIEKVSRKLLRCEVKHADVMKLINEGAREIAGLEIYSDVDVKVNTK